MGHSVIVSRYCSNVQPLSYSGFTSLTIFATFLPIIWTALFCFPPQHWLPIFVSEVELGHFLQSRYTNSYNLQLKFMPFIHTQHFIPFYYSILFLFPWNYLLEVSSWALVSSSIAPVLTECISIYQRPSTIAPAKETVASNWWIFMK